MISALGVLSMPRPSYLMASTSPFSKSILFSHSPSTHPKHSWDNTLFSLTYFTLFNLFNNTFAGTTALILSLNMKNFFAAAALIGGLISGVTAAPASTLEARTFFRFPTKVAAASPSCNVADAMSQVQASLSTARKFPTLFGWSCVPSFVARQWLTCTTTSSRCLPGRQPGRRCVFRRPQCHRRQDRCRPWRRGRGPGLVQQRAGCRLGQRRSRCQCRLRL